MRSAESLATQLFDGVVAPLVMGGNVRPMRPIGHEQAQTLASMTHIPRADIESITNIRMRKARRLLPVGDLDACPSASVWLMAVAFHDLVQAAHPDFESRLWRSGPQRIMDSVKATLRQVRYPDSVLEAIERHTWFSRVFDLVRDDTHVSWWSGSTKVLGSTPPPRLLAWPELRRVAVTETTSPLADFASSQRHLAPSAYLSGIVAFLNKTPVTDLATITRPTPKFEWTPYTLALLGHPLGRRLALRALSLTNASAVHASLGAASRPLLEAARTAGASGKHVASKLLRLLGERFTEQCLTERASPASEERVHTERLRDDVRFAVGAGAFLAQAEISVHLAPTDAKRVRDASAALVDSEGYRCAADVVRDTPIQDSPQALEGFRGA